MPKRYGFVGIELLIAFIVISVVVGSVVVWQTSRPKDVNQVPPTTEDTIDQNLNDSPQSEDSVSITPTLNSEPSPETTPSVSPSPTTRVPTKKATASPTSSGSTPTNTPTPTVAVNNTNTPTPTANQCTNTPTPTSTSAPTDTPIPSTNTPTPVPVPTNTPVPEPTNTPAPTSTPTNTPTPTCGTQMCGGSSVNTCTNVDNCRTCGTVCPERYAANRVCNTGACSYICQASRFDCNSSAADGCEIQQSVTNCSMCGNDCTALPNVDSTSCNSSACVINSCDAGYVDANHNSSDGCEQIAD